MVINQEGSFLLEQLISQYAGQRGVGTKEQCGDTLEPEGNAKEIVKDLGVELQQCGYPDKPRKPSLVRFMTNNSSKSPPQSSWK